MEKTPLQNFDHRDYRQDLADTLKSQSDKETRKKILQGDNEFLGEQDTLRYKVAEEKHKDDIRERIKRVKTSLHSNNLEDVDDEKYKKRFLQQRALDITAAGTLPEMNEEKEKANTEAEMASLEAEYEKLRDEYFAIEDVPRMPDYREDNKYYSISINETEGYGRNMAQKIRVIKFSVGLNYDLYRADRKEEMVNSPLYASLTQINEKLEKIKERSGLYHLIPFYSGYVERIFRKQRSLKEEIEKYERKFNNETQEKIQQKAKWGKDIEEALNERQEGQDNPLYTLKMFLKAGLSFERIDEKVHEVGEKDLVYRPFAKYHGSYQEVFAKVESYNEGVSARQQQLRDRIEDIQSRMRALG